MADGDTAVADPEVGTVPEEIVATSAETLADSAQLEGADSDTGEELTDPVEVDPLDALADDDLIKHPKIETLLTHKEATARESERQLTEKRLNEGFAGWFSQEQNRARSGATFNEFVQITAEVAESAEGKLNAQQVDRLARLAQGVAASAFKDQWDGFSKGFRDRIAQEYPDYRMPRSVTDKLDAAQNSFKPEIAVAALFEAAKTAAIEAETPKLRKTVAAELKQQQKTNQIKQAASADRLGPTAVNGSGVPGRLTLQEIEAMPMAQWTALPKPERDRLLAEARR